MGKYEWVIAVKDDLKCMPDSWEDQAKRWRKRSIYKVPVHMTGRKPKAYKPQVVSFGPYHHGEEHLMPMEEHKHRALLHFLKRTNKPLEFYVTSLAQVADDLKHSYDSLDPTWQRDTNLDRFLKLMVVDGCFMLEVLSLVLTQTEDGGYAPNDPIFSSHGMRHIVPNIWSDMLMLENQLPLLVLYKLVAVEKDRNSWLNPPPSSLGSCLHVLDMHRRILIGTGTKMDIKRSSGSGSDSQLSRVSRAAYEDRSASWIEQTGIHFKKSGGRSLLDISYKYGVLRLPAIVVGDASESMFLNLMVFERLHVGAGNEVTSYICFMRDLIDQTWDVGLLQDQGIVLNGMESQKAVVELFRSLTKEIVLDPAESSLAAVHCEINYHCNLPWNRRRATFLDSFFSHSQWGPFAVWCATGGAILFFLTIIQTVYTVLAYYKKSK